MRSNGSYPLYGTNDVLQRTTMRFLLLFFCIITIATLARGDEECLCKQGQFRSREGSCLPCPPGTFQDKPGTFPTCKPCPKNFASSEPGAVQCTFCGRKSISRQNTPTRCVCKHGFKARFVSPEVPVCQIDVCPPGREARMKPEGGFRCSPCVPGTFKSHKGSGGCQVCPLSTFSNFGATSCFKCGEDEAILHDRRCGKCPPGTTRGSGLFCEECPGGTFKSGFGNSPCRKCPQGTGSLRGSARCLSCPTGTVPIRGKTDRCGTCPPGKTYERFDWLCTPCSAGFFSPRGRFLETCKQCPPGTFAKVGSERCTGCSKGTVLMQNGKCGSCPPGTMYSRFTLQCEKCAANTFSPGGDIEECRPCSSEKFSAEGSSRCMTCPPGTAFMTKLQKCAKCPQGKFYIRDLGLCAECFEGISPRSSIRSMCESCPRGTEPDQERTKCVKAPAFCSATST